MSVGNIKPVNQNVTTTSTNPVTPNKPTNNTPNAGQVRQADTSPIMQQNPHILRHQPSNVGVNPKNILNMFRPRRLGDRSLSGAESSHNDVPTMHPDTLEEVFALLNGVKKAKSTVNVYTKKLFKRFGQVKNIIDSNYEPEDENDKKELQNVKRKTTSTIKKEDIKSTIEEMIGKDPTNAYILIEHAKRELGLTGANAKDSKNYTQLDKAIIDFSKDNYATHAIKIRADVNIADEADKSGKTQFRDLYYVLTSNPHLTKMIEIYKVCHNHAEFMALTNLFAMALTKDKNGKRIATSCPNTIHAAISVMDKRGKINTMYIRLEALKKTANSFVNKLNSKDEKDKNNTLYNGLV
jgi:hypothetical protein